MLTLRIKNGDQCLEVDVTRQKLSIGQFLGVILKGTAMVPRGVQVQSSKGPRGIQEGTNDGSKVGPSMIQDESTNDPRLDPIANWVGPRMVRNGHPRIHVWS